jgi:uncharacterized protein
MNPFFFGDSASPLFGVYHPAQHGSGSPASGSGRDHGVVLCYPVGGEYLRAHRAFRQLTNLLVRSGVHVLRFDYSGTGDSAGDPLDATLDRWTADVGTAVEELRDSAGITSVSLAGLRLGAVLALGAARAAASDAATAAGAPPRVDRVALWDPVADGRAFLDAMEPVPLDAASGPGPAPSGAFPPGTVASGGFPWGPRLVEQVAQVDLQRESAPGQAAVEILTSAPDPGLEAVTRRWTEEGSPARYRCIPSEGDWAKGDRFGSALIPQAIIQGVVEALLRPLPSMREAHR